MIHFSVGLDSQRIKNEIGILANDIAPNFNISEPSAKGRRTSATCGISLIFQSDQASEATGVFKFSSVGQIPSMVLYLEGERQAKSYLGLASTFYFLMTSVLIKFDFFKI